MPRKDKINGFVREISLVPITAQERTDKAVRLIRESEAEERAALTADLRAARLARDGGVPSVAPASDETHTRD